VAGGPGAEWTGARMRAGAAHGAGRHDTGGHSRSVPPRARVGHRLRLNDLFDEKIGCVLYPSGIRAHLHTTPEKSQKTAIRRQQGDHACPKHTCTPIKGHAPPRGSFETPPTWRFFRLRTSDNPRCRAALPWDSHSEEGAMWRDNLGENGASIRMRRSGRERLHDCRELKL
jgi:hypothetical protein